jgi:diguanylate cyclase (GGDEF)-like protein
VFLSFRNRLSFFFVLLVILPVAAVAVVGVLVLRNIEQGKTDARLAQGARAAEGLYRESRQRTIPVRRAVTADRPLAAAVASGNRARIEAVLEELQARLDADALQWVPPKGGRAITVGVVDDVVAPVVTTLRSADGAPAGTLSISTTTATEYMQLLNRVTGLGIIVARGSFVAAKTVGLPANLRAETIPLRGTSDIGGSNYRIAGFEADGMAGNRFDVRVLASGSDAQSRVSEGTLGIVALLIAFLVCAFAFALTAARSLQNQTDRLLRAAQALGRGDFSVEVPAEGNDEFAALGREFNSMARQLNASFDQLELERARLYETVRRVGESLGKGLDRDALLGIVVQTAVDGVESACGRVILHDGGEDAGVEAARSGDVPSYLRAIEAAEELALRTGEVTEMELGGAIALVRPLISPDPGEDAMLGVMSIARPGRSYSEQERELFAYLAQQAALSIENVDLHQAIRRQAMTDGLTGLSNHRRFQEVVAAEVERVKRFPQDLALVMLDLDNFKQVNDTYGHLQGDLVLREVAHVLRESSREIDEPARYGGEEMAVALPQTGVEGAYEFAERVRRRIEALELPLLDGRGKLRVTASFGAAARNGRTPYDKDELVAAADAALYKAKRSGKNRTEIAG